MAAGAAILCAAAHGATATGTAAEKIAVVDCSATVHEVGAATLTYNPGWTWVTNMPGAHVVLEKTLYPRTAKVGVPKAVTTVVQTFAADQAGEYVFTPESDDERCATFTHRVYSESDAEIGTALTAEVSVGVRSAASAGVFYDDATNAMEMLVAANGIAPLAHSVAWVDGAATFTISDECTALWHGVAHTARRTLLTGSEEGSLAYPAARFGYGEHELSIAFADSAGAPIQDATRTVRFALPFRGFIVNIR